MSGSVQPWEGGAFTGTYTTGEGISTLLVGNNIPSVQGDVDSFLEAAETDSFTLEFRQQISDALNVGIAYGEIDYDDAGIDDVESIHVNAFYSPVERLTIGVEYIAIENGDSDADRIGASLTFTF